MKNKFSIIFIVLIGIMFYGATLHGVLGNIRASDFKNNLDQAGKPFELSPERGRFAHIIAMGENRTYALTQELADAVYPDVGYHQGKFYSFFAPGISYMALPFYVLGREYGLSQVFVFAFISLMSVLSLVFLFKISREILKLPVWLSVFSVIIFAFGSTAWSYATTLYQHHLTVFFILSSFYAVWRYKNSPKYGWSWASFVWLNYALAVSIDYPNAILMLPVMVYFLVSSVRIWKVDEKFRISLRLAILSTAIVFIIISGLHAYHNYYNFGGLTKLSSTLVGYKTIQERQLLSEENLENEIRGLEEDKTAIGFFREKNIPFGFYTLFFSPDRGLFLYAPIFILALLGVYSMRKEIDAEYGILLALAATNIFLYSSWGDPWGGWAYGPRYLIPSMAILSLFVAIWIFRVGNVWSRLLAFILFVYSSAIALLGVLTTNAVPPKVEADFLGMKYNFLRNIDFLMDGKSSSFLYNNYFAEVLTLQDYFLVIYGALVLIMLAVLFVLPRFESRYDA